MSQILSRQNADPGFPSRTRSRHPCALLGCSRHPRVLEENPGPAFFGVQQLVGQREWWNFLIQRLRMSGTSEERTGSLERPLEQEIPPLPRRHVASQFKDWTESLERARQETSCRPVRL